MRLIRFHRTEEQQEFSVMFDPLLTLLIVATALNGLLAGASLDQSIKQLPARRRIGVLSYAAYSRAADLGNGIVWYAGLGLGAAGCSVAVAVVALVQGVAPVHAPPIAVAAGLSILHSLTTTRAAPTLFSQRRYERDEAALTAVFDRFERWQTVRVLVQVLTFGATLWALATYVC
jgi:hypothetical protein